MSLTCVSLIQSLNLRVMRYGVFTNTHLMLADITFAVYGLLLIITVGFTSGLGI